MVDFWLNGMGVRGWYEEVAVIGILEVVISREKGFEGGRIDVEKGGTKY